jgi:hypothetical protein
MKPQNNATKIQRERPSLSRPGLRARPNTVSLPRPRETNDGVRNFLSFANNDKKLIFKIFHEKN